MGARCPRTIRWRWSSVWAFFASAVLWCLHARHVSGRGLAVNAAPDPANASSKPTVCVRNPSANPRTASLWKRGTPERYGSRYQYLMFDSRVGKCVGEDDSPISLILLSLGDAQHRHGLCRDEQLCISTNDELCQFPLKYPQHNNVIMRQYYTTKYEYPGLGLGPRYEFRWVPYAQRVRPGPRRYLFSFMGSIDEFKPDRWALKDVVEGHDWRVPIKWKALSEFVKVTHNALEYRDVLLNSSFTLCPVGTADDTYRFWEAIEAGSIPIFVPRNRSLPTPEAEVKRRGASECPDSFLDVLATKPPIVILSNWTLLPAFIEAVTEAQIQRGRQRLAQWHEQYWRNITRAMDDAIEAGPRSGNHTT